ncbi:MAG: hypothetical protein KAJ12_08625, partial [Bacteroidetes bacterium]|nr:hypothetical protein [Bacteroidota bacterium]
MKVVFSPIQILTSGENVAEISSGFTPLDYAIVVVYLVGIALFGILRGGKQRSAQEYFLGKERIPWWIVCFAIVAAETSTLTFISIPGLAYL